MRAGALEPCEADERYEHAAKRCLPCRGSKILEGHQDTPFNHWFSAITWVMVAGLAPRAQRKEI